MGNTNSQKMPVMSLQDYYSELEMKPVTGPGPWVRIEITIVRPQIKPTLLPASTQAKLMIHGCIKVICKWNGLRAVAVALAPKELIELKWRLMLLKFNEPSRLNRIQTDRKSICCCHRAGKWLTSKVHLHLQTPLSKIQTLSSARQSL